MVHICNLFRNQAHTRNVKTSAQGRNDGSFLTLSVTCFVEVSLRYRIRVYVYLTDFIQPSLNANPAPISSVSFPPKIELKSPSNFGASPLIGAFGLATRLLLSCPAFDGKVGNILVALGRGSWVNQAWARTSAAEGRFAGLSERSEFSRSAPDDVSRGNLERIREPVVVALGGRRRARALGRRRKPGQVSSVGRPHSSKIYGVSLVLCSGNTFAVGSSIHSPMDRSGQEDYSEMS